MKVQVKLISETGEAVLQVHVIDRVKGKNLYSINNDAMENGDLGAINLLTNSDVDQYTDTPSYKRTSCRLEVITKRGKSPLNPNNFRVNKNVIRSTVFKYRKMGTSRLCFPRKSGG